MHLSPPPSGPVLSSHRWSAGLKNKGLLLIEMLEKCQELQLKIIQTKKLIITYKRKLQALEKEHLNTVDRMKQREDAYNHSERRGKQNV